MSLRGIYGGTFDPVHLGHLRTAWEVAIAGTMPVHMVLAHAPPHRSRPGVSPDHRWNMLKIALAGQGRLIADDRELRRPGPSYMIDTVDSFRSQYPGDKICLILGQDAAAALDTWHRWRDLLDRVHLVIMTRPGGRPAPQDSELAQLLASREVAGPGELEASGQPSLWRSEVSALDISATAIREQFAGQGDPRFLLIPQVLEYIEQRGLYQTT